MGSLSIWHWLIVLVVVVLIFGTKKLRNIGGDVGGAVKEFKNAMNDGKESSEPAPAVVADAPQALIAAEVTSVPVVKPKATPKKATAKPKAPVKTTTVKASTEAKPKAVAKKPAVTKPKTATKVAAK